MSYTNAAGETNKLTLTDYLAGAVLANGFVWIWAMVLGYLQAPSQTDGDALLGLLSYVVFVAGGAVASYLVCKRAGSNHLFVGLKVVGLAWIFSAVFMPATSEASINLALVMLVCFVIGGLSGTYLARRMSLRGRGAQIEKPSSA
jgi:peptidoglycan/LPS O-acetylase OafA/YrhL